eukprot:COSAG01_NODE_59766_length_298_cov_0.989950_1_plen_22_part_01
MRNLWLLDASRSTARAPRRTGN